MVPVVDRIGLALFEQAAKGHFAPAPAVGDLKQRRGALAHVGLVVMVAGVFESAALFIGKIKRKGFGHGSRPLHIRNTRVECNRSILSMLPD